MILSLDDLPGSVSVHFDVAVIGAGAAGITLALELQGSGLRVAVFEAGDRTATDRSTDRYRGPLSVGDGLVYPPLEVWRLRQLGGTTNHWQGFCQRMPEEVFRPGAAVGTEAWPIARSDLDPAYSRAHQLCQLGREVWDAESICADSGFPMPFEHTDDLTSTVWRMSPPTRFGTVYADELERSEVEIYLQANVVSFDIDGDRVKAVRLATDGGDSRVVTAETVVLACGGIENVRQLLVAAEQAPGLSASGTLGAGFMEHPHVEAGCVLVERSATGEGGRLRGLRDVYSGFDIDGTPVVIGAALTNAARERDGLAAVSFTFYEDRAFLESLPHHSAIASLWGSVTTDEVSLLRLYARSEQRYLPESRITLSTQTDDLGSRRAALRWELDERDVVDIEASRRAVVRELARQGFGPSILHEPSAPPPPITGGAHHMGGARMHESDRHGVVDPDLRTHAVRNLFVTGGAVFPRVGFSNPTLTVVALAVRLARLIRSSS